MTCFCHAWLATPKPPPPFPKPYSTGHANGTSQLHPNPSRYPPPGNLRSKPMWRWYVKPMFFSYILDGRNNNMHMLRKIIVYPSIHTQNPLKSKKMDYDYKIISYQQNTWSFCLNDLFFQSFWASSPKIFGAEQPIQSDNTIPKSGRNLKSLAFFSRVGLCSDLHHGSWGSRYIWYAPTKINSWNLKNDGLEDDFPFPGVYSQVSC